MEKISKENGGRIFVVAGISGDIGIEFARRLVKHGGVYGISRKSDAVDGLEYRHVQCDLLNPSDVRRMFDYFCISNDFTYVHLLGKFQFQDENHPIVDGDNDGLDDDTFNTNVVTFRNVAPYLSNWLRSNPIARLKLVAIGSTSDLYDIPYWHSFTHSKNELRKEFRKIYGDPETYGRVGSLFINVSTTDGRQLAGERPYISKRFLLTPKEILDRSLEYVLDERADCVEISVLKPNPEFGQEDYLGLGEIRRRWYKDMYGEST